MWCEARGVLQFGCLAPPVDAGMQMTWCRNSTCQGRLAQTCSLESCGAQVHKERMTVVFGPVVGQTAASLQPVAYRELLVTPKGSSCRNTTQQVVAAAQFSLLCRPRFAVLSQFGSRACCINNTLACASPTMTRESCQERVLVTTTAHLWAAQWWLSSACVDDKLHRSQRTHQYAVRLCAAAQPQLMACTAR